MKTKAVLLLSLIFLASCGGSTSPIEINDKGIEVQAPLANISEIGNDMTAFLNDSFTDTIQLSHES